MNEPVQGSPVFQFSDRFRVNIGDRPLSSWKEIAAYVGKGVRTVQRWEVEQRFPVRRPTPDRRIVLAIPGEIDAWILRNQDPSSNGEAKLQEQLDEARAQIQRLRKEVSDLHVLIEQLRESKRG